MKSTSQVAWKASFQAVFWKVVPLCLSMLVDALPKIEVSLLELFIGSKNDFRIFPRIRKLNIEYFFNIFFRKVQRKNQNNYSKFKKEELMTYQRHNTLIIFFKTILLV